MHVFHISSIDIYKSIPVTDHIFSEPIRERNVNANVTNEYDDFCQQQNITPILLHIISQPHSQYMQNIANQIR